MPDKIVGSNPELQAYLKIQQTAISLTRHEEIVLSSDGLSPERFAILRAVKNLQPPVIENDIARYVYRKANSVTLILDRMERIGLVKRVRSPKDRRAIRIIVTPKGEAAYQKGQQTYSKIVSEILSGLSDKEIEALDSTLEKILAETLKLGLWDDKRYSNSKKNRNVPAES